MTLYEIDSEIMNCIDTETGEIIDTDKIESLQMERSQKIRNIALWIKDLKAEAEALKVEKDNFAQRQRTAENKIDSLKKYLAFALNGEKVKETEYTISYRKSEAVEVVDVKAIPIEYIVYPEPTVNKLLIKDQIKHGINVPGAQIVEHESIIIK